jgi:Set1/Ash2 histone methyltransferase complex subunit ASH2
MSKRKTEVLVETPPVSVGQCLSATFKERRLRLSDDKLTVTGDKGYQTVLSEYSGSSGKWYFEVQIEDLPPDTGHVRVGWSTRRTRFDQPIGSDCFSFALRDSDCAKVCLGRKWDYGSEQLKAGDVVGCFLLLPEHPESPTRHEDPMTFLPNLLCDPETVQDPDIYGPDTEIRFSVNGTSLGTAFKNLVAGEYYPAVSLYGKSRVRFNFGPNFAHLSDSSFQAACGMYVPKELMKPKRRPQNFIPRGLTSGA